MDPTQYQPPQGGYPPQTPQPQPQQPVNPYQAPPQQSQQPTQPQYQPQPQTQQYAPQPQPYTPPQPHQPQPAAWYTPAPKPDANKPADASSYLQSAGIGVQPQSSGPGLGQTINGQYSIDYLDQMAAPIKQPLDKKFIFAGIGAVVALLVAGALLLATPNKTASVASEVSLYTTMVDVEATTKTSTRYIKNSSLSAINSNMRTTIINATRDMQTPLTNMGQNPTTLKSAAKNAPYHDDKFTIALEDARLNSVYDRVYANEVNAKMKYMIAYMESIEQRNSRESMQEFIGKNKKSFETIQSSIDEWTKSEEASLY